MPNTIGSVPRIVLMTRTSVLRFNGEAEAQLRKHPIECAELRVFRQSAESLAHSPKPLFKSRVCLQAIPVLPGPLRQDNLKQSRLLQFFGIQSGDFSLRGFPQTLPDIADSRRVLEKPEFRSRDLGDRLQQHLAAVVPIETDPFATFKDFADS
jgi:hypothetical protein